MRFEVLRYQPNSGTSVADSKALTAENRRRGVSAPGGRPEYWGTANGADQAPKDAPQNSKCMHRGRHLSMDCNCSSLLEGKREKAGICERVESLEAEKEEDSLLLDGVNISAPATSSELSVRTGNTEPCAHVGRLFASRQTWRLVFKDGSCNVTSKNVSKRRKHYLVDLFTTFVDMRWRYNLAMFGAAFLGTWVFFSLFWWSAAVINGDHFHANESSWDHCVDGVSDFTTALLFSIETQHTIGFGTRAINTTCPHAIMLLMIQCCVGIFIHSLMTGLIFAKLSRPKGRARTLMFSRQAVICMRDGEYCLLFRLGDMRKSHIINTSIRGLIVRNRTTREGEMIPLCQYTLKLEAETNFGDGFVFLVWPMTLVHRIDENSPLWDLSAESLLSEHFEIIVILEGVLESTGNSAQFRTSYLPSEILWGQRLSPLFTYQKSNGQYEIDFTQFHNVVPVESMPTCSAKEFHENCKKEGSDSFNQRENYFHPNFTVLASESRISSRYQSLLQRKLGRAKGSSLMLSTTEGLRSTDDNGVGNDDNGVASAPVARRYKHRSVERLESQSPDSITSQSFRSRSGSDRDIQTGATNNNGRSQVANGCVNSSDKVKSAQQLKCNGINLYPNIPSFRL